MYQRLFSLEWKAFFRSASLRRSIGLKILMGFLAVYFILLFLLFGIGLYPLIEKYYPGQEVLAVANRYLLLWLLIEFSYRFFLQNLPVLNVRPLLILPVKKRKLVNFILLKSLFSIFNFLSLLIIIPFGIFNIYQGDFSPGIVMAWMLAVMSLVLCVNYLNFAAKKKFTDNLRALLPAISVVLLLVLLDFLEIFRISLWFGRAMDRVLVYPALAAVPLAFCFFAFHLNRIYLKSRFYLDSGLRGPSKSTSTRQFLWTRYFGDISVYLQQDLKLIWRNKRPRTAVYISVIFLVYGLIFYPQESYEQIPWFFVFVGIFMTGVFMINFGQFIPAWDANYYPLIMSQNISLGKYLAAKAGLLSLSVFALAILTTPYAYFGWRIFVLNLICAVYNIGVNVPVLLYAGSFNRKRIDLDKSPFLNYQGTGAAQWLVGIPLMAVPVFLFWIWYKFTSFESAAAFLFLLGVLGLVFRNWAVEHIAGIYRRNKYAMIEGFRKEEN